MDRVVGKLLLAFGAWASFSGCLVGASDPQRVDVGRPPDYSPYWGQYFVIDLPSLTVRAVTDLPDRLPERIYRETSDGHAWEWKFSMGGETEPDWFSPFVLPAFLKGVRVQPLDDDRPFGGPDPEVYFELEAASGDYVRCAAERWREPPLRWDGKDEREGPGGS